MTCPAKKIHWHKWRAQFVEAFGLFNLHQQTRQDNNNIVYIGIILQDIFANERCFYLCIFCSVRNWISAVQLHVPDACFHSSFSFALKMLLSFTLQFFWFCLFCIYLKTFISTALYFTVIPSPSRFSTKYSLGLGQKSIKRKEKV